MLFRTCLSKISGIRQIHSTFSLLAGHSKWANIKHIKALKDGQKSAQFIRYARQIRLAVQDGGSADPSLNSQLRSAMDDALKNNMPMSTIQNSIKKSQQSTVDLKKYRVDIRYKQKVYAICVVYTENFTAAKMDINPLVKKLGGVFVDVSHMFNEFGLIDATLTLSTLQPAEYNLEERATEDAIECGAEEVEVMDESIGAVNFICHPNQLNQVRQALQKRGYTIQSAEHIYSPNSTIQLPPDELKAYEIFIRKLRDIPCVEDVYDNIEAEDNL